MTLQEILTYFDVKKRNRNNSYQCTCPCHKDKEASLTISEEKGKILICCHAGCKTSDILEKMGLSFADLDNNEKPKNTWKERLEYRQKRKIEAIYDYVTENGKYLYSKVRFEGKIIRYVTIDRKNDNYAYSKKKDIATLYRLPELIKAVRNGYPVYIVEGEKDVETLRNLGLTATTAGGVDDWKKAFASYFTGANVVVLADNDNPGSKLRKDIIKDLKYYAHSIRWTITSKKEKGDVSDYITKENHTKEDLLSLINSTETLYAPWIYKTGAKGKEVLRVNGGILADCISKGLHYLVVRRPDDDKDDFYIYENGVYKKCNKNKAKSIILRYIPISLANDSMINNVYNLLLCQERKICTFWELDKEEKYINLRNGLYNIETGQLEAHTPQLYSTIQLSCEYHKENNHRPIFERYINDLCSDFDGNIDQSKKAVLQEYGGLLLSNIKVFKTKLSLVLWSLLGNTGKTQFIKLICALIGEEKTVNIPIQNMNERSKFAMGNIPGSRVICVGDQTSSEISDSSLFKQLTGGDPLSFEKKGKQPFNFTYPGGIIIACNNLPSFTDDKGGHLFERLCVVPCTNTIDQQKRDGRLLDKMLKEQDAIFNWFLEGLHRLIKNNYKVTKSEACEKAVNEYREKLDTVYRFISEFYRVTGNREDMVSKPDFENAYITWCDQNNYNSVNRQNIKERMEANGCPISKARYNGKAGVMVYRNITEKNTEIEILEECDENLIDEIPF